MKSRMRKWTPSDHRAVRGGALTTAGLAVALAMTGCMPHATGTEALADEVVQVSDQFAAILQESADTETSELDDLVFTALGRDLRELVKIDSMVAVSRGLLSSAIDERDATAVMVLATDEETPHGLDGAHSNAFTCVELVGTFQEHPNVERRNVECSERVMEAHVGTNYYSVDELNCRSQCG